MGNRQWISPVDFHGKSTSLWIAPFQDAPMDFYEEHQSKVLLCFTLPCPALAEAKSLKQSALLCFALLLVSFVFAFLRLALLCIPLLCFVCIALYCFAFLCHNLDFALLCFALPCLVLPLPCFALPFVVTAYVFLRQFRHPLLSIASPSYILEGSMSPHLLVSCIAPLWMMLL